MEVIREVDVIKYTPLEVPDSVKDPIFITYFHYTHVQALLNRYFIDFTIYFYAFRVLVMILEC